MNLPLIKNGVTIAQVPIPDNLTITKELMGSKEFQVDIELPNTMPVPIGAYVTYKGENYTINTPPLSVRKINNYRYSYSLMFESALYRLYDKGYRHLGNRTFQYFGSPADYAQLIVDNINEIDAGWSVGVCDVLPEIPITFSGHTCRTALDHIAESFAIEWMVQGKTISFKRLAGNLTTLEFSYGNGNGLYELGYQYQNDKNVVTRATGYGSSRNLPADYRNGATQLMFSGKYLDKNIFALDGITPLYGIKEGDYVNEAIYPEANGLVSAVNYTEGSAIFALTAATLDFDLNAYFGPLDPKLSFKTGELQGQEFKIRKYEHGTRTITLDVFTDGQGNNLPNATFQPAIGDIFDLFDMYLPTEIVQDAEDRLQAATQEWLNENSVPRVKYNLDIDPLFMREHGIELNEGDQIRVIDASLGIDDLIRIVKITTPFKPLEDQILPGTRILCDIANFIPYGTVERLYANDIDNKNQIITVDRTASEKSRLSSLEFRKLAQRMFDPDGNLAQGAESLFAAFIQVGFDSQNFELIDAMISANTGNDPNAFSISAGKLVHNVYSVEGLGYEWIFPAQAWAGLDPLKFYYVYAKASKTSLSATWEISETPVFVNDIPGFWAFNLGQLYEVNTEGYRSFKFTKGITNIVGNMIDTGTIDADLVNVINLVADNITSGTIDTARLDAATITSDIIQVAALSADQLVAGNINASIIGVYNLDADNITSGTIATGRLDATTIKSDIVQTTDLNADKIVAGTLNASVVDVINLDADNITSGSIDASIISVTNLDADNITSGGIDASVIAVTNLDADNITAGTIDASVIDVVNINADNITAGTVDAARVDADNLFVGNLSDGWIINKDVIQSKALVGGVPKTQLKTDGSIDAIDATITGTTRTAATGKRAELSGPNNNFRLYDASGNVIFDLDDDSAIESITGGIPVYGPGIRVGQLSGNNASVSPRGLYVKDSTTGYFAYIRPSGIYTDGDLQANGQTNVEGLGVGGNLSISSGSNVLVGAEVGRTYVQDIGGGYGLKFVKGIYIDTVPYP